MSIHISMLILQFFAIIVDAMIFALTIKNTKIKTAITCALNLTSTLVQITICYICWVMGSSIQLRKF